MLARLETVTVAEAATNRLRESLFAGDYTAGQEIKDTHVSQEYKIARPTARVAVQQLINEGMLVREPGCSAQVRRFDPEQVADLYRARRLIELDAVRELKSSPRSLGLVEEALGGFAGLKDDGDWSAIAKADVEFHRAVVDSAGSHRLRQFYSSISSEIRLLIAQLRAQYSSGNDLYEEHAQLLEHLRDSTSETQVVEEWTEHLDSAKTFLEQHVAHSAALPGSR